VTGMQIKIAISKKARRRILAAHQIVALGLAGYAVAYTSGWQLWLLLAFAAEAFVFSAVYAVVVAPAPRPRTPSAPRQRATSSTGAERGTDQRPPRTNTRRPASAPRRERWIDLADQRQRKETP